MEKKYEIIIYWSNEDGAYVAEVPELAGCMADGKTYQEALANAEKIIEEWIETAVDLGRPIRNRKAGSLTPELGLSSGFASKELVWLWPFAIKANQHNPGRA